MNLKHYIVYNKVKIFKCFGKNTGSLQRALSCIIKSLKIFERFTFVFLCVYKCVWYDAHLCSACRVQKRILDLLKLGMQAVRSYPIWLQGTKLGSLSVFLTMESFLQAQSGDFFKVNLWKNIVWLKKAQLIGWKTWFPRFKNLVLRCCLFSNWSIHQLNPKSHLRNKVGQVLGLGDDLVSSKSSPTDQLKWVSWAKSWVKEVGTEDLDFNMEGNSWSIELNELEKASVTVCLVPLGVRVFTLKLLRYSQAPESKD